MTGFDSSTEIVEDLDGFSLTKSVEVDTFKYPSIVYDLDSDRDEEVTVRIVDSVPAELSVATIGMHPSFGGEYWSVEDDSLVFVRTLEPRANYRTLYAIRPESSYEVSEIFGPPQSIELLSSAAPDTDPATSGDFLRSTTCKGDRDSENAAETSHDVDDADADPPPAMARLPETEDSLVAALAAELEAGDPSRENLAVLESHFGETEGSRGSLEARVDQLQTDMATLSAYTSALEEFLDEDGSAQEVLDDHESRLGSVEETLSSLQATTAAVETDLDTVQTEIDDIETAVDSLSSEIDDVATRAGSVSSAVDDLEGRVPDYDVGERITALEADVAELSTFVDDMKSTFE